MHVYFMEWIFSNESEWLLPNEIENCQSIRNFDGKQFHKNDAIKAIIAINLIEIAIFITMIKKYYFPRDQYDNNISCRW